MLFSQMFVFYHCFLSPYRFLFFKEPFVYCQKLLFWFPALVLNCVSDVSVALAIGGHLPLPPCQKLGLAVCVPVLTLSLKENHIRHFVLFNAVVGLFILCECKLQSTQFLEFRKK